MDLDYPDDYINQIICEDCLEVMKDMPDNCIDTIITDPPYGLSFLNQKWDYDVPSIEIWQECLRVLKPGGTALIFAGSRTQHRMAVNIEDAGFILKDCIIWLYGSGFPKATDISKQLDKRAGAEREATPRIRVDGKKTGMAGGSFMSDTVNIDFPEAITPEAKLWNGWKSPGLKPAYEPILVCMKPNEGSYANNALKWGIAGLNIDGGRIEYKKDDWETRNKRAGINAKNINYGKHGKGFLQQMDSKYSLTSKGRFPANIILDEESARMLDEQSGVLNTSYRPNSRRGKIKSDIYMNGLIRDGYPTAIGINDKGGASRFFYCAKASKSERNGGCENLFWLDGKRSTKEIWEKLNKENEKNKDNKNFKRHNIAKGNIHPTVKSLSLMKYLVKLTMMPNKSQIYLDPFCGSGTTLIACKELKRDYIGIDNNPEYFEIARRRIKTIPETLF